MIFQYKRQKIYHQQKHILKRFLLQLQKIDILLLSCLRNYCYFFVLNLRRLINLYMIKLYNSFQLKNITHFTPQKNQLDVLKRVQKFQEIIKQNRSTKKRNECSKNIVQMLIPIYYTDASRQLYKQPQSTQDTLAVTLDYTQKKNPDSRLQKRKSMIKRLPTQEDHTSWLTLQHSSLPVRNRNIITSIKKQRNTITSNFLQSEPKINSKKHEDYTTIIAHKYQCQNNRDRKNFIRWNTSKLKANSKLCKSSLAQRSRKKQQQQFISAKHSSQSISNNFLNKYLEQQILVDPWKVDPQL